MKDYFGYFGKVCIVTGAGSGIGRATAELLVELGAEVYALDFKDPQISGVKCWVPTDLSRRESIDEAFAQIPKKLDCFFGIAGVSGSKYTFAHTVTVDFIANRYITETYLDHRLCDGGRIAYVASQVVRNWYTEELLREYRPLIEANGWNEMVAAAEELGKTMPATFSYIIAKRAISYFAAQQTAHFAKRNIRVNCIIPTSTNTGMMAQGIQEAGNDAIYRICMGNDKPYATPDVMAKALVYLNSDFAAYISGVGLYVDWGLEAAMRVGQADDPMGMGLSIQTMLSGAAQ